MIKVEVLSNEVINKYSKFGVNCHQSVLATSDFFHRLYEKLHKKPIVNPWHFAQLLQCHSLCTAIEKFQYQISTFFFLCEFFSISIGIEPKQLSMQMQVQHLRQEAKLQLYRSWGREMEWKRWLVKWWHIAAWRNGKMRLMWLMAIAAIGSLRVQLMHLYNFLIKSNALACRFIVRMVLSTCMRVSWFHLYFIYMVKVWDLHMCLNNRLKSKENMVTNGLNNKVYTLNLYCY